MYKGGVDLIATVTSQCARVYAPIANRQLRTMRRASVARFCALRCLMYMAVSLCVISDSPDKQAFLYISGCSFFNVVGM